MYILNGLSNCFNKKLGKHLNFLKKVQLYQKFSTSLKYKEDPSYKKQTHTPNMVSTKNGRTEERMK